MKKLIFIVMTIVIAASAVAAVLVYSKQKFATEENNTVGYVEGTVSIGPICPVERPGLECKPGPEVYAARKIAVYDKNKKSIIKKANLDNNGYYKIELKKGDYIIDIDPHPAVGVGAILGVPKKIHIEEGKIVEVNIDIDTGIR